MSVSGILIIGMIASLIPNGLVVGFRINFRGQRSDGIKCPVSCGSKNLPVCHCDDDCHIFNDCCLEAIKSDKPSTFNMDSRKNAFSCDLPYPSNKSRNILKPFGVTVVQNCLPKFQLSRLAEKCFETDRSNFLNFMPVTSKDGLTYTNVYCALCNGEENVELWDIDTHIDVLRRNVSNYNLTELVKVLAVAPGFFPIPTPSVRPRICIRTIRDQDRNQTALCHKYQEPVLYGNEVFRNHHCIDKNRFHFRSSNHPFQVECIEGQNTAIDRYIWDRSPRHESFRISFAMQMEHESTKCKAGDIVYSTKVKCVRLGCVNGEYPAPTKTCKMFEIMYSNYRVSFVWNVNSIMISNDDMLKRYATLLMYVLYINKFISLFYVYHTSYKSTACHYRKLKMDLAYTSLLSMHELVKLHSWLDSLLISYLETYAKGTQSELLQRVFDNKRQKSETSFEKKCTESGTLLKLKLPKDKDTFIKSLAKYQTPFLIKYQCLHINLTLSVTEKTDGSGEIHREYKPTEFYCVNGQSAFVLSIVWLLMFVLCASYML